MPRSGKLHNGSATRRFCDAAFKYLVGVHIEYRRGADFAKIVQLGFAAHRTQITPAIQHMQFGGLAVAGIFADGDASCERPRQRAQGTQRRGQAQRVLRA